MNRSSFAITGRQLCAAVALSAIAVAGCLCTPGSAVAEPIPVPDADPFYAAPPDLATLDNGAIVRSREIQPYQLTVGLPIKTWQVQYKSTDGTGGPTTGVTTVVVPTTPWTGPGGRPLVSYQIAEDSLGTRCTTSYSIRAGLGAGGLLTNNTNFEAPITALLLQRNWAVVLTDYQGPESHYLDGMQAAHGVLDGIRAALAFGPAGLSPKSPLGAMGYSGGSFATISAAVQQPNYAPELHLDGIAVGGVGTDYGHALRVTNGSYYAGLGLLVLAGLDRSFPEADIPSLLNDRGRTMLAENSQSCGTEFLAKYMFANFDQYTADPNIDMNPRIAALSEQARLQQEVPAAPTYIWHSIGDELLPIVDTDALVQSWCAAGATVTYVRTSAPTHIGAALAGTPGAIDYLGQRFGGVAAPAGCG